MKRVNKNKTSPGKKHTQKESPDSRQPNINPNRKNSSFQHPSQLGDSMIEFHLHDQQPESINAKRKLEEFSIQIEEQTEIDPFKRNQNTINLLKKNLNSVKTEQYDRWTDEEIRISNRGQNQVSKNKHKKNRVLSACPPSMRHTLKSKSQNQKKHSFNVPLSPNKKLNLSFNNILPIDMETIYQNEMQRQIVKKVKSYSYRQTIASCYEASQKKLTLFDKDHEYNPLNAETLRIHSTKQVQNKRSTPVTFKDKDKFLKTVSFNSFNRSLNKPNSKKASQNFTNSFMTQSHKIQQPVQQAGDKIISKQRSSHTRTCSQPLEQTSQRNTRPSEPTKGPLSQRKNLILTQKRRIIDKKMKSQEHMQPNDPKAESEMENFLRDKDDQKDFSDDNYKTRGEKSQIVDHKPTQKHNQNKRSKQREPQIIQNNFTHPPVPTSTNLNQDFSLLIKMLQHQSQNVFGNQLHSYVTQIKNNHLYNYYYSGGVSRKKNGKQVLNASMKINRGHKQEDQTIQNDKVKKLLGEQQQMTKNNTTKHYTSFSSTKNKQKDTDLLRTSNTSFHM